MIDLVIGLGEIGLPLAALLEIRRNVAGRDIDPPEKPIQGVDVLHICFACGPKFVSQVLIYQQEYNPELTIIHSTVVPGTTRAIAEKGGQPTAYSPIRGRHDQMMRDLIRYTKFVAAPDIATGQKAWKYLYGLRLFEIELTSPVEALELAKLLETTYSGVLIAWAQEIARFAAEVGVTDMAKVLALTEEVEYLPDHLFYPGHIGGHCLMQNLALLEQVRSSPFIDSIIVSNENCTEEQKADKRRFKPRRFGECG